MSMWDRLAAIEGRFEELTAEMAKPEVAGDYARLQSLTRERAAIEDVVETYRAHREASQALEGAKIACERCRRRGNGCAGEGRSSGTLGAP